ncbi:MAG: class II fructose-bisphosphate aldolase [Vigna little leaf phytoplasma]|nr:class II fructose-bisphosphate aldolase [Vigna little leaf phytoplasma]
MLTSDKKIIKKAHTNGYAIAQINVHNLEWIKAVLETAKELKSPIIIGVSENAAKYMGDLRTVAKLVYELDRFYNTSVPIILHLDHGSFDGIQTALSVGFNSVMFNGSRYDFEENLAKTKEIVNICHQKNVLVEAELGIIGGTEDSTIIKKGEKAKPEECQKFLDINIDLLSAGIGNFHGPNPKKWEGLDFNVIQDIRKSTDNRLPLVLHGGSEIPSWMIRKAISLGIVKINVNTEFQIVFAKAIRKYIEMKKDLQKQGFVPQKLLTSGFLAIKNLIKKKITLFGSINKA